jgi:5-methylthioadenosine/S-adenosylhomocysteine deaminase
MMDPHDDAVDLLIVGGDIVVDGTADVIHDGVLAVRGNRIAFVGPRDGWGGVGAKRTLDCRGKAVVPGFIDCHVHTCQQLARGLADEVDADEWMRRIVWFEAVMTASDVAVSARAACLEMIKSGTTGFMEACANPLYVDVVGEVVRDAGLRGILSRSTIETSTGGWQWNLPLPFTMDAAANLSATREMIETWHGAAGGRIGAWCGWRHLGNLTDDFIVSLVDLARDRGVGLNGHVGVNEYGEVDRLDRLGVLGPDMLFTHGFKTTSREVELLAHHQVKVSHNPGASVHGAYGASVVGRIPEMLAKGVCVCLGSDSAAGGNRLDVLHQAYLAAVLHKEVRQVEDIVPAHVAWRMATRNGAVAVGWDDVGYLAEGAVADIAVIDVSQPHLVPAYDLVGTLVYSGSGRDVVSTIVDGQVLMADRHVEVLDETSVLQEVAGTSGQLVERWRDRLAFEYPDLESPRV